MADQGKGTDTSPTPMLQQQGYPAPAGQYPPGYEPPPGYQQQPPGYGQPGQSGQPYAQPVMQQPGMVVQQPGMVMQQQPGMVVQQQPGYNNPMGGKCLFLIQNKWNMVNTKIHIR